MGFTALDGIGSMLGWHLDLDPLPEAPIDLSYVEFEQAVRILEQVGFPTERAAEEAWPDFHGWRVNYETAAYRHTRDVFTRWAAASLMCPFVPRRVISIVRSSCSGQLPRTVDRWG